MARGGWFRRQTRNGITQTSVPDGLWNKCPQCSEISFARDVERSLNVCPKCGYHHRLSAKERLALTVDENSFEEMDAEVISADPLAFPDYEEKLAADREKTGEKEAIVTGLARIEGRSLVIGV